MPASYDPTEPQLGAEPVAVAAGPLVGQVLAGRYALTQLLGSGGMGAVYRAHDRELDEVVAVKVLHREVAGLPGMLDHFRSEVKLARRVTHRNVARTFEFGEHQGLRFLTMEYIRGEPLTQLVRLGPLSPRRAAAIGIAVCDALTAAHTAGIVHRDIKPDNVLMTVDRVVVTDFGIARSSAPDPKATGTPMGTPAYMAPEQVAGRALSARTDLYALGVMLFELLTGEQPWTGEGVYAVALRRLQEAPPDPRTLRADLPAAAAAVVLRCMATAPEDRYASAEEVAEALRPLRDFGTHDTTGTLRQPAREATQGTPLPRVLAVMPLRSHGADDYVVEGLWDDLLDALSCLRGIRVLARGATQRFRGTERDVREVGQELRADVMVEGSVRKIPRGVRVALRLVEVATGYQSWSGRWDVAPEEVLGVQDAAAQAIIAALSPGSSAPVRAALEDPEAVALYLRGKQRAGQFSGAENEAAIDLFELALGREPNNPRIASSLSMALVRRTFYGSRLSEEVIQRAWALAEGAVQRAPSFGEPHLAMALLALHQSDGPAAVRSARAAISRAPNLAEAHELLGRLLLEAGRTEEGLRRCEVALALDPNLERVVWEQIRAAAMRGDRAEQERLMLVTMGPERARRGRWLFHIRYAAWRRDAALLRTIDEEFAEAQDLAAQAAALVHKILDGYLGRTSLPELFEWLDMVLVNFPLGRRLQQWLLLIEAELAGYFGRTPELLQALRRADEVGVFDIAWFDGCPLLDAVRQEPGFAEVRARVQRRAEEVVDAMWGA